MIPFVRRQPEWYYTKAYFSTQAREHQQFPHIYRVIPDP